MLSKKKIKIKLLVILAVLMVNATKAQIVTIKGECAEVANKEVQLIGFTATKMLF